MKQYPETHQVGIITIEQTIKNKIYYGDFGIQIGIDGRIWICIDGKALIRFKPMKNNPFKLKGDNQLKPMKGDNHDSQSSKNSRNERISNNNQK